MIGNRGYFGIGIYNTKNTLNVGTLWRSASNFGAAFVFTIGRRYREQSSDTVSTPLHTPLYRYTTWEEFIASGRPSNCPLIGVEQSSRSQDLATIFHPERAIYLLGSEDTGLPERLQDQCQMIVHVDTLSCLNVAVAGSILMYDRQTKFKEFRSQSLTQKLRNKFNAQNNKVTAAAGNIAG